MEHFNLKLDKHPLQFPCDFIIKIMGEADDGFEKKALRILHRHCLKEQIKSVKKRHSKKGNYLALSVTVHAENKAQLDSIYIELSATPEVLVAL